MHIPTYDAALAAWRKVEPRLRLLPSGCLILSEKQYRPTVPCGGPQVRLARVAYIAAGGAIPSGATCLRHTCDDLRCVAPDHLEPGTDLDNADDRRRRGRNGVGWKGDVCPEGHDTTVTGVRWVQRICAECAREQGRRRRPGEPERIPGEGEK